MKKQKKKMIMKMPMLRHSKLLCVKREDKNSGVKWLRTFIGTLNPKLFLVLMNLLLNMRMKEVIRELFLDIDGLRMANSISVTIV